VVREVGLPEVYFAFDDETDAKKFAAFVQAEPVGSYPGWASQCAFEMDSAKIRELEASLPAQTVKMRDPHDPTASRVGLRHWPRAPKTRYDEE
jgi:hypothetical protein